ncbi:hypothetical protein SRHO_G00033910 [Serrasalmus rhombeus]
MTVIDFVSSVEVRLFGLDGDPPDCVVKSIGEALRLRPAWPNCQSSPGLHPGTVGFNETASTITTLHCTTFNPSYVLQLHSCCSTTVLCLENRVMMTNEDQ